MQELTGNFTTASNCPAFRLTSELLTETLEKARKEGRDYAWGPIDDDYWLAEKSDFNYEISCPNFIVGQTNSLSGVVLEVEVCAIFESYQGYENFWSSFAKVFQVKGDPNLEELVDIARMFSYLRFSSRDYYREVDRKFWSEFLTQNVVSNETILIFTEDKDVARTWAQRTFPNNYLNAWVGKCGEFVFAGWAGECNIPVSRVDLKKHEQGDEYDFSQNTLLINTSGENLLKMDIKTFQLESGKQRDWWNVGENCLAGDRRQDLIVFVVVDENFKMGKVVGYLSPEEILEKGEYVPSDYSQGYYRVYIDDVLNPYYLRATIDQQNQIYEGLFFGSSPYQVVTEIIKGYPLDPITAYYSGYDWHSLNRGGLSNLTAKPTLKMFVSPK
ncbi:hypothetical protein [Limnospira platensis]|uniref:hypothetical protein n=1 Tax=Limnospira platensis TaxID=118562 RepID=UPI003D6FBA60